MIVLQRTTGHIAVHGHSGYAPFGQDIVCEAVSALVQTYVASLVKLTDEDPKYTMAPGSADIDNPHSPEGFLLMQSFLLGMNMLAEAYPDNIKII